MLVGTVLGIRDWVSPDASAYLDRLLVVPADTSGRIGGGRRRSGGVAPSPRAARGD